MAPEDTEEVTADLDLEEDIITEPQWVEVCTIDLLWAVECGIVPLAATGAAVAACSL